MLDTCLVHQNTRSDLRFLNPACTANSYIGTDPRVHNLCTTSHDARSLKRTAAHTGPLLHYHQTVQHATCIYMSVYSRCTFLHEELTSQNEILREADVLPPPLNEVCIHVARMSTR